MDLRIGYPVWDAVRVVESSTSLVLPLPVGRCVDLVRTCIQRLGWIVEGYAETSVRARVTHRGRVLGAQVSLEFSPDYGGATYVRLCARTGQKFGPLVRRELSGFNDTLTDALASQAAGLAKWYASSGIDPLQDRLVATFGPLELYADRLVTPEKVFNLGSDVRAEVQSGGDIVATRGRNIAAGAGGVVLFGPLGMLLGAAKTQTHDFREVYLLVEGPGWAYGTKVAPAVGLEVRRFAQEINVAARQLQASDGVDQPASEDRLSQLERLGELHATGVLTDVEFQTEKSRILTEP